MMLLSFFAYCSVFRISAALRAVPSFVVVTCLAVALAMSARLADAANLSWVQLGDDLSGDIDGVGFGKSVALSADGLTAVVGIPEELSTPPSAGSVQVFDWNGFGWVQRGSALSGTSNFDRFGEAVSISADGNTIAVGANGFDGSAGLATGLVRVFDWVDSAWTQRGGDLVGAASGESFGSELALSSDGNVVASSAPTSIVAGNSSGLVRVFSWNGSAWVPRGDALTGIGPIDQFGASPDLNADGSTLAVGARAVNQGSRGRIDVLDWDESESAWVPRTSLTGAANGDIANQAALSADGSTVVVGARLADVAGTSAGQVRVFDWINTVWMQRGSAVDGVGADDGFGAAVAVSDDGNVFVAGGGSEFSGAGDTSQRSRVFEWDGAAWNQRGQTLVGDAMTDQFGESVAISANGATVAVGASQAYPVFPDFPVFGPGYARIFDLVVPLCNGLAVTVDIGAGELPTGGDDVILGTEGADTINARGGDDTVCGLGGNDTINGGNGVDVIFGGEGNDTIGGQGGGDRLEGEAGADRLNGGPGNDELFGGEGEDDLRGQSGADTLDGGAGVDQFFGGSGNDIITTGPGGNLGTGKVVRGQGNNDTITGSSEADDLDGGPGLDQLFGGGGDDLLRGGNAADRLFGQADADTLEGGASNDELRGGTGDDILRGGTGDDELFGEGGDDTLDGQGDTDDCNGGSDTLGDSATNCETTTGVEL